MPLLPTKFIVPSNQTLVQKDDNWINALLVRMKDLVLLDEKRIVTILYPNIFKNQKDDEKHLRIFENGDLVLWLWKDRKIKKEKFFFPWSGPFWVKKTFDNNIVWLSMLSNEDVILVNINKLKPYQNPMELMVICVAITIITENLETKSTMEI